MVGRKKKKVTLESIASMLSEQGNILANQGKTLGEHGNVLKEQADMLEHVVKHMATKEDVTELRAEMATKEQLAGLHAQVNSIERQLRETKTEVRLSNLEDRVFGAGRA